MPTPPSGRLRRGVGRDRATSPGEGHGPPGRGPKGQGQLGLGEPARPAAKGGRDGGEPAFPRPPAGGGFFFFWGGPAGADPAVSTATARRSLAAAVAAVRPPSRGAGPPAGRLATSGLWQARKFGGANRRPEIIFSTSGFSPSLKIYFRRHQAPAKVLGGRAKLKIIF